MKKSGKKSGIIDRLRSFWAYASEGVWSDTRKTWKVKTIKVLNLSVNSFLDRDLQKNSMSLTYSTILAIVPALAMVFAIARGFGFQNIIHDELFRFLPSQQAALEKGLHFVDSYLAQASQGVFVGVGIVFLLYTLISLLSSIEDTFNYIWGIKESRKIYSKITDYITVCLLVPVLMMLSSGLSIFLNTLFGQVNIGVLTPVTNLLIELIPLVLTWLAFTFTFYLMPNTKVRFTYAMLAGFLCMLAFQVVQWLLMTGQIYVSKYNAIYGSFSFLPLLLIWMQLSWLIVLAGCVLCYSMQNVVGFNFTGDIDAISHNYVRKVSLVIFSIIMHRYESEKTPYSVAELSMKYGLPVKLVNKVIGEFLQCNLVYKVDLGDDKDYGVVPSVDKDKFTVGELFRRLDEAGRKDFIPHFAVRYAAVIRKADKIIDVSYVGEGSLLVKDLEINHQ